MRNANLDRVARAAGTRLADERREPELVDAVERELAARREDERIDHFADPVAIGGLIVSVANLAWVVYEGLRRTRDRDAITKEVDDRLPDEGPDPATRHHVITIVVDELLDDDDQR